MGKSKEPIRLRQRKTASGNITLYLDIYLNGKRSYEYLKLYLIPETNRKDKEKNRQTLQLAEAIKAKRVVELQNGEYGFNAAYKLETNFLDYYRAMCEKRHGNPESRGNWGNWYSCLKHLERYCKPNTTFKDITPEWIIGFREHLDKNARCRDKRKIITTEEVTKPLSQNSKVSYFNKLRACINQAFEEGQDDSGTIGIPFRWVQLIAEMNLFYQTVVNYLIVECTRLRLNGRYTEFDFYCCHTI